MERRTNLGVEYSNKDLGIEEENFPLTFHFLEEGCERDAERKDVKGKVIGYASACYPGGEDGQVLFVQEGCTAVEAVHKSTVIYQRKPNGSRP